MKQKKNRLYGLLGLGMLLLAACSDEKQAYDATGTFEATEVIVSAEQNGRLLQLTIAEGDEVEQGQEVGLIDTVPLYLTARRIGATKLVYAAQRPDLQKQIAATRQQLAKAQQEYERWRGLVSQGAANQKQVDDVKSQMEVLQRQLDAQTSTLRNAVQSVEAQMGTADIEALQVVDQLQKCHVSSPISGTILTKYMEQGEFAAIGKPLFKVADIEKMYIRAYVTSSQLSKVKIGDETTVFADYGGGDRRMYRGKVTWIASKAEFTPKSILTNDERADQVYAVKVAFQNDGFVKIGMYGEVKFGTTAHE